MFRQLLKDYCKLLDAAGEQEAAASLDHVSREVTKQHAGVDEPEGGDS